MQTEENLNYTKTELHKDMRQEHRSLAFATRSKQTLKESSVKFELLQESAEATTVKKLFGEPVSSDNVFCR